MWAVSVVVLVTAGMTAPALVAQDLDQVERQVDELDTRLQAATQKFEDAQSRAATVETDLDQLSSRATRLEAQATEANTALAVRAREAFMYGGDPVFMSFLSADGIVGAVERAQFLEIVNGRDRARLAEAVALRAQLDQTRVLMADRAATLQGLQAQLAEQRDVLDSQLAAKQRLATDLRSRAARQRQIDNGVQNGIYSCPHDANSFVDSWGASRSGGRSHKGVDLLAPQGVPVYAFTTGRITRMNHGNLGGTQLYLFGDDGTEYFYAHLDRYADTAFVGKRVEAGEMIAYNGATGNAAGGPAHIHFEAHPGGGAAVNPYPYALAACR